MTPMSLAIQIAKDRADRSDFADYDIPDIQTAYAVQDALTALEGPVGGYKIAWNRPELLSGFGVEAPAGARVLKRSILPDGAVLSAQDHSTLMLEPEIAAVLAEDIPIVAQDADSVARHVGYLVPAFEVLDRRRAASRDGLNIIAQGVFNAGLVLGTPSGDQIGATHVRIGDTVHCDSANAAPEPPMDALAYLANLYAARGVQLRQGDVILCGAHTPLLPVAAGDDARMAIAGLGEVTLRVE
ncbi:fumarylacetoacetate hydrolase family protein [Pontivivens nitratireducens]|uniref:Fumarylacetoacetase-like C-terminal domain-containing protein n=1 Tax=Pontivivens nitratireducens TaxID=2758038 RepID=A0A6G7VLY4_9RHOB|nr:fumarylacetoacetate hydrolase family protein [Pontibrevibacter nitratireducens]QIK41014.1 hypothetical protein G8E03_09670 [Pontibrevibacter nitratireducens]